MNQSTVVLEELVVVDDNIGETTFEDRNVDPSKERVDLEEDRSSVPQH